jgi:CHAD domain-containing protein
MAMPSPLHDSYEQRVRYFDDSFALVTDSLSSCAIHDMRVGLKRLRTFFNLVATFCPEFAAEEAFLPARKLFRAAGKVRNLHVLEAKVREASQAASLELSEYYNWLKEEERRAVIKFSRARQRFDRDFFASAWTGMAPCLEGPAARRVGKGLEDRFLGLLKEIRKERSMRRDVRRLHFLRTRTKEARYTLEIIQEGGRTGDRAVPLNECLKNIHQSLGRWHDEEIVLESLREFRKVRTPGPLVSFKSYLEYARLAKARKAESLTRFETSWAALKELLGRGTGRRLLRAPASPKEAEEVAAEAVTPPRSG